jgi:hypothetical protein
VRAVGTVTSRHIRDILYDSPLKAIRHLVGTALKVIYASALITIEMSVKIGNAVIMALTVWRYDSRNERLLRELLGNIIDGSKGQRRIIILKIVIDTIARGMSPVVNKIMKYEKSRDCYSYSRFSQSILSTEFYRHFISAN